MCLFKYKEKRYGKLAFILFSLLFVALGAGAIWGGIVAFNNLENWLRIFLLVAGIVVGAPVGLFGLYLFAISFSLTWKSKSVRDGNKSKGIADTRLCDVCGRVISKKAEFCEHCGDKQASTVAKECPSCKAKVNGTAEFCEKCGFEFRK